MLLIDVNVLVHAHKEGADEHDRYREWLVGVLGDDAAFGMSDLVLNSVIRVVTHPKIFDTPSSLDDAFAFTDDIRSRPNCVQIEPGPRHWSIFQQLCRSASARGNLITDAWLAALAIESGSEWITTDRDFARFDRLRWRHPLAS